MLAHARITLVARKFAAISKMRPTLPAIRSADPRTAVSRGGTCIGAALRLIVVALGLAPLVQAQTFLAETAIPDMPSDVAVTPDGTVAIVRASQAGTPTAQLDRITAWDMTTGLRLTPILGTPPASFGLGENQGFLLTTGPLGNPKAVHFSDLVRTTNSRAIAIGSQRSALGQPDDTTFVDFLSISPPSSETNPPLPPSVGHMVGYTLTDPTPTASNPERRIAGHAHDVAISPNGAVGVVSHRNWVHFYSMNSGGSLGSDNIGSHLIPFNGISYQECDPDKAVDSVEATDTRAVVITTKLFAGTPSKPKQAIMVVYVYDLTTTPVTRIAAIHIDDGNGTLNDIEVVAHDLAITPDGMKVVVTGHLVAALIDLSSSIPTLSGLHVQTGDSRTYKLNADTVEVTNTRAVVTASVLPTPNWCVEVFDLGGFGLMARYVDSSGVAKETHDLAITPDGRQAVVRAGGEIIVIQNLATPPAAPLVLFAVGDPLFGYSGTAARNSYVSDSIVATNSCAVTIGTFPVQNGSLGVVNFINLSGTPAQMTVQHSISNGYVRAGDLKLSPDGRRVVVRCADNVALPMPPTGGFDIHFFSCGAGSLGNLLASFGASNNIFGVDSLEIGAISVIGISEARTANNGTGTVQVIALH